MTNCTQGSPLQSKGGKEGSATRTPGEINGEHSPSVPRSLAFLRALSSWLVSRMSTTFHLLARPLPPSPTLSLPPHSVSARFLNLSCRSFSVFIHLGRSLPTPKSRFARSLPPSLTLSTHSLPPKLDTFRDLWGRLHQQRQMGTYLPRPATHRASGSQHPRDEVADSDS